MSAPNSNSYGSAEAATAAMRSWRTRVFVSTWVAYAGMYFGRKAFSIVKKPLGDDLMLDVTQLGHIGAAYLLAYSAGQFVAAAVGRRTGARVLLLFGLALTFVVNIVFGLSNSYAALMVFMVLNGLAQATGWSTTVGTLGSWTSRGERGTLMGIWGTCYAIGSAVAAAYAAFWLGRLGWRGAFFAASVVLLVVWLVVYLYQRNRPEDVGLPPVADADEEQVDESNGAAVWRSGLWTTTLLIGTFYFFVKFVRYALDSWTPYLLDTYFGMKPEEAGYVSTLFAVFGPLGVFVAGYLSDRVFNSRRASISFLMILGMVLGCGMLQTLGAVSTLWFGVSIAVIGFMLYGPDSLLTGASAIDLGGKRGALMIAGVINGMGSLGAVAQEYVVPWLLRDGGVSDVFTSLVMASLASMLILGVVLWRNHRGLSDV